MHKEGLLMRLDKMQMFFHVMLISISSVDDQYLINIDIILEFGKKYQRNPICPQRRSAPKEVVVCQTASIIIYL